MLNIRITRMRSCWKKWNEIEWETNVAFGYITDRIDKKEVRVEYYPTEIMRVDPHTKPLLGLLFREHRDWLLNIPASTQVVELQECVETRLAREQYLVPSQNGFHADEDGWTTVVIKRVKRCSKR
jgi:hypothetical protein